MSEFKAPKHFRLINSENYLINSYLSLTRIKAIHFLFIFIEILLNIFLELDIFVKGFKMANASKANFNFNIISIIKYKFDLLEPPVHLLIVIFIIVVFDLLYIFVKLKKIKINHIYIIIIINFLELFFFRVCSLILFNIFFTLKKDLILFGFIFLIFHLYLTFKNFLNNHLYYFVPEFINYPYDEFSSSFDIILLFIKLLLAISSASNNSAFGKFCFLVVFIGQIFFSFYFIIQIKNHSYLLMKNIFLNKTRLVLFFTKTVITIFALVFGNKEITNILFIIICFFILIIIMVYIYLVYNPFFFITIKTENSMENIFFYLFILSEKNDYEFVIENKINDHYEKCGLCGICKKYTKYRYRKVMEDEEKEKFINEENAKNNNNENANDKIVDLFDIIYDGENKYFNLMKKIILNYKEKGKESLFNNSYYYINFSFLIFSDYEKNNINLTLNEKLLLEVLNRENCSFLDNHETQINQLLLCNSFISLSKKIFDKFKEILNSEPSFKRVKKIIELSSLLNEMKNPKFKKNLFSHKSENVSNSKHLILICSVIYEEIFNTKLNNSQIPIRENIQPLEDIFYNNSKKINKIISLSVEIANKTCKIIRAGKGLYSDLNSNLFDLFPLVFKEYQIGLFMDSILKFENMSNKERKKGISRNNMSTKNVVPRMNTKNVKGNIRQTNNKAEFVEIKLIIGENILSKMYYKLLTLRLTPLFNNNSNHFILLDGLYFFQKHIILTHQNFDENPNAKEEILGVSEPKLEKGERHSLSFKKYANYQNNQGFMITKILSFNKSEKFYHIYHITKKEKEMMNTKLQKKLDEKENNESEEDEDQISNQKNRNEKVQQIIEDNASVTSQQTGSSLSGGVAGLGIRNKKNDNIYEFGGFNKIRKIIFGVIFTAIIILIIEYFYLISLKNETYNNNNSLLEYRDFYKLYFQLFSSTLGIACIYHDKCLTLTGLFIDKYLSSQPEDFFNYTLFVLIQNQILSKQLLEKRSYLNNIHKCIGNEKYNKIFGREITYYRVSQNTYGKKVIFNLTSVKVEFSEAILIICNSFQILNSDSYNPINLLNKIEDPFSLLNKNNNNNETNIYLTDYQKEFYEMLLNYRNYHKGFNVINDELVEILFSESNFIQIFIYFYLTFNIILILIIGTSVHTYNIFFENMLIKIINYINMTINLKNDDFSFSATFLKKIENLQCILQFDINDPIKGVQNLNNIYSDYQTYLTNKNKTNAIDANKKNYKKLIDNNKKNELDNIPKNERIMTKKDVIALGITFLYRFTYYFNFFIFVAAYVILLAFWTNYFTQKKNLYELIQKNILIESSIYRAINIYDLMVFHNYTLDEVSNKILADYIGTEKNALIKSFYLDIEISFMSIKEKNNVKTLYQDFEDTTNFTCENLFELNSDNIKEILKYDKGNQLNNLTTHLIRLCEFSRITESNDFRTVFERHFQYIRNGILSLNDFSYDGIIDHIINDGTLSKISLFFNSIIIFIIEITNKIPFQNSIKKLLNKLGNLILVSEIVFLCFDLVAILFVIFLYIKGINQLCNQIFGLRKIFKIYELQE